MDAITDPAVRVVVMMSAAQVGKTEALNNAVGFHIDRDPSPILVLQPTLDMAQAWSKDRLAPMLRDSPCLRGKVKDARSRDSNNTVLHKVFPGGHVTIAGANSAASLASRPIRIVAADEIDRYPSSAGTEGDPVSLAEKRSMTFWNRKLILFSTPTVKDESRIEKAWSKSDQRRYYVPCPSCACFQTLRWEQVKWEKGRPETAAYQCEACGELWSEAGRIGAVMAGEWRASMPSNGIAGFHLNALISPWVRLTDIAQEFLDSKDFPEKLRVFVNTVLGETWEEKGAGIEPQGFLSRREHYGPELPVGSVVLTAGVDVQDDRLEVELVAWGRGEECWSIWYKVIRADPSTNTPWRELDDLLARPYRREDGLELRVSASAIDTGGHHTQASYAFCRDRYARRVWAVKGASDTTKPIWPRKPTRTNIGKVNLFMVGVHAAKDFVYGRLKIAKPGPGYCHFPDEYDAAYFAQLTAEKVVTKFSRGQPKRQYVKASHERNEALDVRVYAVCAFAGLSAMGLDLEREAQRLDAMAIAHRDNAPLPGVPQRRVRSRGIG